MKGFESEVQQLSCTECGVAFEAPCDPGLCLDCLQVKLDWFWELWSQTHTLDDEAAGVQPPA